MWVFRKRCASPHSKDMTITTRCLNIDDLPTPCLLLDQVKMENNIRRMAGHIGGLSGVLRPHVKTNKSIEVTRRIIKGGHTKGITVSTLSEAKYFFQNGFGDILYAVGIAPNKLLPVAQLMNEGYDLKIVLDSVEMAKLVAAEGQKRGIKYKTLIELDTDGHRSGVSPNGDELLKTGSILHNSNGTELIGVMTHAGESYNCRTPESLLAIAHQERDLSVLAAERLRAQGFACPVVSVGSTPTALVIDDLASVTEVRAGVYVFFDLVMAGIGVCNPEDIAVSVLASITGYQKEKNWVIIDGGWTAMSRDRGTENQEIDYGYGLVRNRNGAPFGDLAMMQVNQEHGVISAKTGDMPYASLPLGGKVRILPNHACATAGQYDKYYVVEGEKVIAQWPRINGW